VNDFVSCSTGDLFIATFDFQSVIKEKRQVDRNLQELTGVGETELAALTSGLKIGPKGRFMKAVKRTAFCNGATVFIIFLVFLHISKLLHLESPPVAVFASLCTTTSVVVIALPPG
jgi:hypothetical protein